MSTEREPSLLPTRHTWLQPPLLLQLQLLEMGKFLIPLYYSPCVFRYTVTKANQNEALLWKIAVLGTKKSPVGCRKIFSLAQAGMLHSSMPEMSEEGLMFYILCSHARSRGIGQYHSPTDRRWILPCMLTIFFFTG